jgi:hypothetical protein
LPDLKLVSQPPLQLLLALSSFATFPMTEFGAGDGAWAVGVRTAGDTRRDTPVFAACLGTCVGIGRAACFGASTEIEGSGVAEPAAVCDIAVPLRPHSNAVDRRTTAEGATKPDNLMTCPSKSGTEIVPIKCRLTYISKGATEG